MNGEESEVKKIVSNTQRASRDTDSGDKAEGGEGPVQSSDEDHHEASSPMEEGEESDVTQYSAEGSDGELVAKEMAKPNQKQASHVAESDAPRRRSTRSTKGKKTG